MKRATWKRGLPGVKVVRAQVADVGLPSVSLGLALAHSIRPRDFYRILTMGDAEQGSASPTNSL